MTDSPSSGPDPSHNSDEVMDQGGPLPNRFTRSTAAGCIGIVCVLLLPAVLFVPVELLPHSVAASLALAGAAGLALGIWLLVRMPSSRPLRATPPRFPTTRSGRSPVVDQPATRANRLSGLAATGFVVAGGIGYLLTSMGGSDAVTGMAGAAVAAVSGILLLASGYLIIRGSAPIPAWRWVRLPVGGGLPAQVGWVVVPGTTFVVWGLIVLSDAGIGWVPLCGVLLIVVILSAGAIIRRLPERQDPGVKEEHGLNS